VSISERRLNRLLVYFLLIVYYLVTNKYPYYINVAPIAMAEVRGVQEYYQSDRMV
jgi:hypothetical protein